HSVGLRRVRHAGRLQILDDEVEGFGFAREAVNFCAHRLGAEFEGVEKSVHDIPLVERAFRPQDFCWYKPVRRAGLKARVTVLIIFVAGFSRRHLCCWYKCRRAEARLSFFLGPNANLKVRSTYSGRPLKVRSTRTA